MTSRALTSGRASTRRRPGWLQRPESTPAEQAFDIADLYQGPAATGAPEATAPLPLDKKLRQGYFWIVNNAIISPYRERDSCDGCSKARNGAIQVVRP